MKFISTRRVAPPVTFFEALLNGLAPDGGLYIPRQFVHLSEAFLKHAENNTLLQLGEAVMENFLPEVPRADMQKIINDTLTFPIPLIELENNLYLSEVFHGPTLAFKDVGARFMANALAYYLKNKNMKLTIIVATSGDTGSAIAHGFHKTPNIDVYILYPSGKITALQEKQMTTLGDNIHALEVTGTFDDCQVLVKTALMDDEIKAKIQLTTANSINIARLLPQTIYHGWALEQIKKINLTADPTMVVPSGNFGNLTAALYARGIGFPINHFVAATNANAIVPSYLQSGEFIPKPTEHTLSNAMDVGNPSNFERLNIFYDKDVRRMRHDISGFSISDAETLTQIRQSYEKSGYILDPHTAVGVAAAKQFQLKEPSNTDPLIVTATAHPAKFPDVIKEAIGIDIPLPAALQTALDLPKQATVISPQFAELKKILLASS
ncbi:MAG: threonine synthase [Gammaproteobacteria bacterium]|nr:threonine synthase [Gammaproteobacteria bacterium]